MSIIARGLIAVELWMLSVMHMRIRRAPPTSLTNVAWLDGRRRKLGPEACGFDLKELMVVGEAPEPVMAQTAE